MLLQQQFDDGTDRSCGSVAPGVIPAYTPLEKIALKRPVDRLAHVQQACRGLRVLDLGALDETAYASKRGTGTWLHERIAAGAAQVVGIDSSAMIPAQGLATAANASIHRGDIHELAATLTRLRFEPDIVVAGELIEHLPNPLAFLEALRTIDALRGRRLIMTTPNATALHNVLIALARRESTHVDHLLILSYKTLTTLLRRAGFVRWELTPYLARFTEMAQRNSGWRRSMVHLAERSINVAETVCPLLSFGWIVEAEI